MQLTMIEIFHLVGLVGLEKLVWLDADSRDSRRSYSSPGSNGMLAGIRHSTQRIENIERERQRK